MVDVIKPRGKGLKRGYDSLKVKRSEEGVYEGIKIEVKQGPQIRAIVPSHVWRTSAFKFDPVPFVPDAETLDGKFIEPKVQVASLRRFLKNPEVPMIYGISGNPDDSKAKYFAAYLVEAHLKALGSDANVVWNPVFGGFDNPLMDHDRAPPTMIVLTNLTALSTPMRLEKARDIVEKHPDVPRIVVIAGCDPLSFLATKLFTPINGLAYFSESLIKQRVEVV
jgi:hypothetical protein